MTAASKKALAQRSTLVNLIVSYDEAVQRINEQITAGKEIYNIKVWKKSDFDEFEKRELAWRKYTLELLSRLFDSDKFANEFSGYSGLVFTLPPYHIQVTLAYEKLNERLATLESIIKRCELLEVKVELPIQNSTTPRIEKNRIQNITCKKILIVFANPIGTNQLRLDEEHRTINECIKRSKERKNLHAKSVHASRINDFHRELIESDYNIVHFSGHGVSTGELAFEDVNGEIKILHQDALIHLLNQFNTIECVLLNACYTGKESSSKSMGVPFTIVMDGPISDKSALAFTRAFYDSIGAGRDYESAYNHGCIAIEMESLGDEHIPKLIKE